MMLQDDSLIHRLLSCSSSHFQLTIKYHDFTFDESCISLTLCIIKLFQDLFD
jgi:hypothetical protein